MKKYIILGIVGLIFYLSMGSTFAATMCTMEAKLCPDGVTYVGRTGPNCEFAACPDTPMECTQEAKLCPDGVTSVGRTGPNCEFAACPTNPTPIACPEIYSPVCGQALQTDPFAGIASPQTYPNSCVLGAEQATLVHKGKCIGDYDPKLIATLDTKMQILILKIDTTFSTIAGKINITNKMIDALNVKYEQKPLLQGLIKYMKETLENYIAQF